MRAEEDGRNDQRAPIKRPILFIIIILVVIVACSAIVIYVAVACLISLMVGGTPQIIYLIGFAFLCFVTISALAMLILLLVNFYASRCCGCIKNLWFFFVILGGLLIALLIACYGVAPPPQLPNATEDEDNVTTDASGLSKKDEGIIACHWHLLRFVLIFLVLATIAFVAFTLAYRNRRKFIEERNCISPERVSSEDEFEEPRNRCKRCCPCCFIRDPPNETVKGSKSHPEKNKKPLKRSKGSSSSEEGGDENDNQNRIKSQEDFSGGISNKAPRKEKRKSEDINSISEARSKSREARKPKGSSGEIEELHADSDFKEKVDSDSKKELRLR